MSKWEEIKGTAGKYSVSDEGEVRNNNRGTLLKGTLDCDGYRRVYLTYADGTKKKKGIHRLVAEAFLDNTDNLPEVDHINKQREDNRLENLRWLDRVKQMENTESSKSHKHANIEQYDLDGNYIATFRTYADAVRACGETNEPYKSNQIRRCCEGRNRRTYLGYMWRFEK